MPGQGCPRGLLCLPKNNLAPAQWLERMAQRAIIAAIVLSSLLIQISNVHGQQNQFNNDLFETGSIQREGLGLRHRSAKRALRKRQSYPLLTRRRLFALRRLESDQVVDPPRLAELIKSRDSCGLVEEDWQVMPFERDTTGLFRAYGQLPDQQFNDVPHVNFENLESLPLAVRQSQSGQQFYFYLANASPWRLRVRMRLSEDVSEQALKSIKSLSQVEFDFNRSDADAKVLNVDLAPYDLIGGWAPKLGPIESYSFEYLDDVASELRKRVFALQVKLQQAHQTGALRILSNPKFLADESNRDLIHGWEIGQQPRSQFQLFNDAANQKPEVKQQVTDRASVFDEKSVETYLQIRSTADAVTWIRSQPITPTETGRLSISVWLRVHKGLQQGTAKIPQIRMAIDGQAPDDDYYRFGVVGREPAGSLLSLENKWKQFAVHFDDLPSSLTDLRVGFDVVGEGVVQVSEVELFDRWFDNGDTKRITQLLASADEMLRHPAQFDRCRRLLAEPWAVFLDDHFLLKPVPKSAQQPVPMFRPKVAKAPAPKQREDEPKGGGSKAGKSLKR